MVGPAAHRGWRTGGPPRDLVPSGQRSWGAKEKVGNRVAPPLTRDGGLEVHVRVGTAFARAIDVACVIDQAARATRADSQLSSFGIRCSARGSEGLSELEEAPRGAQEKLMRTTVNIEAMGNQKR